MPWLFRLALTKRELRAPEAQSLRWCRRGLLFPWDPLADRNIPQPCPLNSYQTLKLGNDLSPHFYDFLFYLFLVLKATPEAHLQRGKKSKVSFEVPHTPNFWERNGEGKWAAGVQCVSSTAPGSRRPGLPPLSLSFLFFPHFY